ncbi:protein kinase [Telmatocola sphagniphila]|uniref:Protein kinase n=1 Tax=Telmatocola sphagniphila TaxID=1123043 RepID=A0A8E6B3V6_9BACT|nr:protein kinase [Telmatocola sphagniphila]QVL31468.1 protein kinase [Telmatocola sphagniphila]
MPIPPTTADAFLLIVQKSGLVPPDALREHVMSLRKLPTPPRTMHEFARTLITSGLLTEFHVKNMLKGRYKGFVVGKFKVMQPLGSGGMGTVYLCKHTTMNHNVAMKILPAKSTNDQVSVERFFREARAAAGLNHPNLVRAHDIDRQDNFYYLVMDYVEGVSLHDLVSKKGPLDPVRAAHYIAQAALGLQYIHNSGLAHRDIKPGNLLIDRDGTLRILDLGLARYLDDRADKLTKNLDEQGILGTADYISPEQAIESHNVDNRTDIYSLGATFYFILAGRAPFDGASSVQKLLYHQTHEPVKLETLRAEIPTAMADIVRKMMAKNPDDRFQTPEEVALALEPWTSTPIDPPSMEEIPYLGGGSSSGEPTGNGIHSTSNGSPVSSVSMASRRFPKSNGSARYSTGSLRKTQTKSDKKTGIYAIGGGVILALVIALFYVISNRGNNANAKNDEKDPAKNSPNQSSNGLENSAVRATFHLSSGGQEVEKKTLQEAIDSATPGSTIIVRGDRVREPIVIPAGFKASFQGEPTRPGEHVIWDSQTPAGKPMLEINNSSAAFRNFRFDGNDNTDELIQLSGPCAGFTIQDCDLTGFLNSGIHFRDARGTLERPVNLQRVRFMNNSNTNVDSAINFDGQSNQFIRVQECRFEGSFQAANRISSELVQVDWKKNRFYRLDNAFAFRGASEQKSIQGLIENNVFVEIRSGFHFDSIPGFQQGKLTVRNNLFANPTSHNSSVVSAIEGLGQQPKLNADWIWLREESIALGRGVKPGTCYFRKTFKVGEQPKKAFLDLGCDDSFTVWINGEEVAKSPTKYFTRRIYHFDISSKLKAGDNLIAVEGVHETDPVARENYTPAGLWAQIVLSDSKQQLVATDASWKVSTNKAENWNKLAFDDQGWKSPIHVWTPASNLPWEPSVLESFLDSKQPGLSKPSWLVAENNLRDYYWIEGAPLFDSLRGAMATSALSLDPKNDLTFLRYSKNNKLYNTDQVPEGQYVGYPQD